MADRRKRGFQHGLVGMGKEAGFRVVSCKMSLGYVFGKIEDHFRVVFGENGVVFSPESLSKRSFFVVQHFRL